tara:strand:+ start:865 stop:1251 length:387 start_codon:yes stop_codon:yes gene_type:complete
MEIGYTKLKQTKRAFRIWIEGNKLVRSGFDTNQEFRAYYFPHFISLISSNYLLKGYKSFEKLYNTDIGGVNGVIHIANLQVAGAKRNGNHRPIIDLHNQKVGEVFKPNQLIKIIYDENQITIIGATNE